MHQVEVPSAARALCTHAHVDYEDAFLVDVDRAQDRTPVQWARAVLEDSPSVVRSALLRGWSSLGLKLEPARSEGFVLGWEIRGSTPDYALLGAGSNLGLDGELLFKREQERLLFATFVQLEGAKAHAMWKGVEPMHRPTVRYVLARAGRRSRS